MKKEVVEFVNNKSKQTKNQQDQKTLWIIVGAVVAVVATIGIVVGVLAANGVFNGGNYDPGGELDLKPIIYLYPEEETELTVRLGAPEKIITSYPKYSDGWNVIAYPNGDLIDKTTGNKLYSLYWEGEKDTSDLDETIGFVVKGEDSAEFLEEKLEILGLDYKEKEEFIVYWLPKLESHAYNYFYFATGEEVEKEMPLDLSMEPDTLIRVRMLFEGLDEYKEVEEQVLTPALERSGFTVVEWGGTDLAE